MVTPLCFSIAFLFMLEPPPTTGQVVLDPRFLTLLVTLLASITAAVVSIIQAFQSKGRGDVLTSKIESAASGLAAQVSHVSGQATQAATAALATSGKVDIVQRQTNGQMERLQGELGAVRTQMSAVRTENNNLREEVNRLTALLHERGQARSTDRIAVVRAVADHQHILDLANGQITPLKVEIIKSPDTPDPIDTPDPTGAPGVSADKPFDKP